MLNERLGPYRIETELGSGGMGRVFRAQVEGDVAGVASGAAVALKVVHPHLTGEENFFERFQREARIGQSIVHPNVVRTLDCGLAELAGAPHHYLAMEHVDGQTLRELHDEIGSVPERLCRHIGREVAKGLSAIHEFGAVHRDLKPENVLITRDHTVKVMDLGVALLADATLRLSQTGSFVGSLRYAAPEQFRDGGREQDARVDLHALGVVLYELATGTNPNAGADMPTTIQRILREDPERLGDRDPQLSAFFEEVVHTLLEKDRERRFATAAELVQILEDGEQGRWWRVRSTTIRVESKRPLRRMRIPRETAVYGREQELAALDALFTEVISGTGRVVLLEGEAGIGKSRVVDEFVLRLQRAGHDMNFLFGSYPPGGAATARGAFSEAYREQFGSDGSAAYLEQTPVLVPAFDALLRGDVAPPGSEPLSKDSLQTCFVHCTRALGSERPTVILIDDLHFAPDEGRALFAALARAVAEHRVLLIGTMRPHASEEWVAGITRFEHASKRTLDRLGPKDLMALLVDCFDSERLAEELAMQIAQKSDGNPYFVFEILRDLRDGAFITKADDGTWISPRMIDNIKIPSSVLDLVNSRVADLSEDQRDLLDVAACCGFDFDPGLVGDVLGLRRLPTLKAFGQIERQHRLVRSAARAMHFDHHQVHEAIYTSLVPQLRSAYHAEIAIALEQRVGGPDSELDAISGDDALALCRHFLDGESGDRAKRYVIPAAKHLTSHYLAAQALELVERALDVDGLFTGKERAELILSRVSVLLRHLGRNEEDAARTQEALRIAEEVDDQVHIALALAELGQTLGKLGRLEEAEASCHRAIEVARACGATRWEAGAHGNLGNVCVQKGRFDEAETYYERQQELILEHDPEYTGTLVFSNLATVRSRQGRYEESLTLSDRCIAHAREIGDRKDLHISVGNQGGVWFALGNYDKAEECFSESLELGRAIGYRPGEALATGNLANTFYSKGKYVDARAHYERAIALFSEMDVQIGVARNLGNLGSTLVALAEPEESRAVAERSLQIYRSIDNKLGQSYALAHLASVCDLLGDRQAALAYAEAVVEHTRRIGFKPVLVDSLSTLGVQLERRGETERARALYVEARDLADEIRNPGAMVHARTCLAALESTSDNVADAVRVFGEQRENLRQEQCLTGLHSLWKITGDRAYAQDGRVILDALLDAAPEDARESMIDGHSMHREIMEATEPAA